MNHATIAHNCVMLYSTIQLTFVIQKIITIKMKKLLLLIGICVASVSITNAQTQDKKWNIGLNGGVSQYRGELGNEFYKFHKPVYGLGGISISTYISSHFDASLLITKGRVGIDRNDSVQFSRDVSTATLNFRFNLTGPSSVVRPYIFVGGGALLFDKNADITQKKVDFATPSFGGGLNFRLSPVVMLNIQEMFLYTNADNRDGVTGGENDAYLFHTAGLTFNFGKKKDADLDGVADHSDKCPNTPAGVAVDKTGCPLDGDKDGVADYQDECPQVAGVPALMGCPDADKDGVADKDDQCPDVAGTTAMHGCPDTDGDGITDKDDRCPNAAGSLALNGCPDADRDGVADLDDKCPDTKAGYKVNATGCNLDNDNDGIANQDDACPDKAGTAALRGCPDTDGDGVADNEDRCPKVMGTIANKGCPEMTKEEVKKITQIASQLFFETASAKLKTASLYQLDELVKILNKYEYANLSIDGYCDSQGADDYNLTLSQSRTESVKTYLTSKGIMESRLTATGYGETNPVADNKTAAGRAKNRRVELKTSY